MTGPAQRTAVATEKTAEATEATAEATSKTADAIDTLAAAAPQPTPPDELALASAGRREAAVARATGEREALVLRTASQRAINATWEITQAILAVSVIGVALAVAGYLVVTGTPELKQVGIVSIIGMANLVAGFYFGRTNHARIGDDPRSSRRTDDLDDRP